MKTNFFKGAVLPLATLFFGLAGAFFTTSMGSAKTVAPVQGFRWLSASDPCHYETMCSNVVSLNVCTIGDDEIQLYGKETDGAPCTKIVYRGTN